MRVLLISFLLFFPESKQWLTHGEWVMAILTGIYVILTAAYVRISLQTFRAIKRQAQLTEQQGESNAKQFTEQINAMNEARRQTDELIRQATAQVSALTKQASVSEIAANAATKAAEAALLNAHAVMTAERAWILLREIVGTSVLPGKKAWCVIHFRNYGKTPGRILSRAIELQIGDNDTAPPNAEAVFKSATEPFFSQRLTPEADDPIMVNIVPNPLLTAELHDELLLQKTKFLWLCGIVKYRDVFENVSEEPHETRFCFVYRTLEGSDKFFWLPSGPREYNQAT